MNDDQMDSFMKPVHEEDLNPGDWEFLTEVFSFSVDVLDKILFELGKAGEEGHSLTVTELRNRVFPPQTSGKDLTIRFNSSLKILEAWNFIHVENGAAVRLDKKGFRLFEILEKQEDVEKPYTAHIKHQQRIRDNNDKLLEYQIIVAKQQTELNPKIDAANEASGKIQSRLLAINRWIAIAGIVAAVYYLFGMFDYYEKHSLNWVYCAYFFTGLGVGLLVSLLSTQLKRLFHNKQN